MTDKENRIDSEEKFLEVYGNVRFKHTQVTHDIYYDANDEMQVKEYPAPWHKPEKTLLYRFGFISEQNFWKWREHFRVYGIGHNTLWSDVKDICHKRIELVSLTEILHEDSRYLDQVLPEYLFPHTSKQTDGMVAFTPNEKFGREDRQLKMKFGKFFRKYYNKPITDEQLKRVANEFAAYYGNHELKFADGPKISEIYGWHHVGFGSCMMADDHEWESDIMPTEVYDSPDIKLAYLGNDEARELHARALINVKKKQFSVVYGNEQLFDLLKREGYESGDLAGCRIKRIEDGNYLILPYIDGTCGVDELDSQYLIITNRGKWCADDTEGRIYLRERAYCDDCDEVWDADEMEETYEYENVCPSCLDWHYVHGYTPDDHYLPMRENDTVVCDGERYHEDCINDTIVFSDYDEEYIKKDDAVWSNTIESYIREENAVKVELIEVTDDDYVPEDYDIDEEEMRIAV